MKETSIPFAFLPYKINKAIAFIFLGIGATISKMFPYLSIELKQTNISFEPEEYGALMFFYTTFYFIFFNAIIFFSTLALIKEKALLVAITISTVLSLLILVQISVYPKILLKRKIRALELNLLFALRTMLIQIMSGVSLFEALRIIARRDYGVLSEEFKKTVESISAGIPQEKALEEMAARNPSPALRKALWQIVNGLRAGSDVSTVLKVTLESITRDQTTAIKEYGNKLRLYSLMYVMIGIIFPTLGLTFITVIASFPALSLPSEILWVILVALIIIEFMYVGMIKTNRPTLMGA